MLADAVAATNLESGRMVIVDNEVTKDVFRLEAFYLLYEPPAADCAVGSTDLVRVSSQGDTQKLLSVKKYAGVRATGMTMVGGGQNMAIAGVDLATRSSMAFTIGGGILASSPNYTVPTVEVWKEVN